MKLKEAKKQIEDLEEHIAGRNALIDLMHEDADEAKKRIADLEYQNAGLNGLIDFMREELGELKHELDYKDSKAGRYSDALKHTQQYYDNHKINRNAVKSQNLKERYAYLKDRYTTKFNELFAEYREEYPNNKAKAYSEAKKRIRVIIYNDDRVQSGWEVYSGYSQSDKDAFDAALNKAVKDAIKKLITGGDHLQSSKEVMDARKRRIELQEDRDSYWKIGKEEGLYIGIGRDTVPKLFPMPE